MNAAEFLEMFQDITQADETPSMDTVLADMEEWDSMSIMAMIAYFDVNHGKTLTFEDFQNLDTVRDLARMIPGFSE